MTGFGRAEGQTGAIAWRWEARSVNGRGLDARLRLPLGHERLEGPARTALRERFSRGSIQAALQVREDAAARVPRLNPDAVEAILAAAAPMIEAGRVAPPRLDGLLAAPGVLETGGEDDDPEALAALDEALMAGLQAALDELAAARAREGGALAALLGDHLDRVEALTADARALDAARPDAIRARLRAQLDELLAGEIAEDRVASEAAMLAVKADVREELDRLGAHVAAARELLEAGSPCGRKLDFQIQEMMRESNTLCSKAADMALTRVGLEMKAAVDQMKEQAANVE